MKSKKAASKKGAAKKASKKATTGTKKVTQMIERPTPTERTSAEAATLLGITESGVRQQYRRGNIGGRVVGRKLWITMEEIKRYKRERQPPGRPLDTLSGESHNKRGERETEYQRDYKRRVRAGLHTPGGGSSKKRAAKRSRKAKSGR